MLRTLGPLDGRNETWCHEGDGIVQRWRDFRKRNDPGSREARNSVAELTRCFPDYRTPDRRMSGSIFCTFNRARPKWHDQTRARQQGRHRLLVSDINTCETKLAA